MQQSTSKQMVLEFIVIYTYIVLFIYTYIYIYIVRCLCPSKRFFALNIHRIFNHRHGT